MSIGVDKMDSVNKKKKSETQISTADLIPGKYYLYSPKRLKFSSYIFFYIGKDVKGKSTFEKIEKAGKIHIGFYSFENVSDFILYEEPVIHKKYLYWLRSLLSGEINVIGPYTEPRELDLSHSVLLKTEIIIYTENS
ncbi:MAG TPA: hypothetical protein PLS50_00345 [Candidatus Dojkabacteria bacterium]|nr:hypothetical protein [Candidatus Dojkabacteria bacterium]